MAPVRPVRVDKKPALPEPTIRRADLLTRVFVSKLFLDTRPRLEVYFHQVPKTLTREKLQARKDQAVRFTRDVVGDPDRAAEIQDESLEDYAQRRGIQLSNPWSRRTAMATRKTSADYRAELKDLRDQVSDLEEENESLQGQLDRVAEIVGGEEEEEEEDEEEDLEDGDE